MASQTYNEYLDECGITPNELSNTEKGEWRDRYEKNK
jgi:hypothetical protein